MDIDTSVLRVCAPFQKLRIGEITKNGYVISRKVKLVALPYKYGDLEEAFATNRECAFAEVHSKDAGCPRL